MNYIKSLILSAAFTGILFSAPHAQAGVSEMAVGAVTSAANAVATVTSKTLGWTFGLSQVGFGGTLVGIGGLGANSLYLDHFKNSLQTQGTMKKFLLMTGTAITLPLGCLIVAKGLKNIWNA